MGGNADFNSVFERHFLLPNLISYFLREFTISVSALGPRLFYKFNVHTYSLGLSFTFSFLISRRLQQSGFALQHCLCSSLLMSTQYQSHGLFNFFTVCACICPDEGDSSHLPPFWWRMSLQYYPEQIVLFFFYLNNFYWYCNKVPKLQRSIRWNSKIIEHILLKNNCNKKQSVAMIIIKRGKEIILWRKISRRS